MARRRAHSEHFFWAIRTDETNRLDGRKVRLHLFWWKSPKQPHGTTLMLFATRRAARAWLKEDRGYIAWRPDLRREPHCWRVGKPVRVRVVVSEAPNDIRARSPKASTPTPSREPPSFAHRGRFGKGKSGRGTSQWDVV